MEPPKEETLPNPPPSTTTPPPAPTPWHSFITSHLHSSTTAVETANSSLRSTLSLRNLQYLQDLMQEAKVKFAYYEGAFFGKIKDEMKTAKDHPEIVVGVAVASSFFLIRGPRKFLLRQTLGRFQSEEAQFNRAEKNVKELNLSVDIFKKDGDKLLQRADLAEKEMRRGQAELMNAGTHIRKIAKSIYGLEGTARGCTISKIFIIVAPSFEIVVSSWMSLSIPLGSRWCIVQVHDGIACVDVAD